MRWNGEGGDQVSGTMIQDPRDVQERRDDGKHRTWRERRLRESLLALIVAGDEVENKSLGLASALDDATRVLKETL